VVSAQQIFDQIEIFITSTPYRPGLLPPGGDQPFNLGTK